MATESVSVQMRKILDSYSEEVQNVTNKSIDSVAKESAQKLRSGSPVRPGGGSYARGWAVKKSTNGKIRGAIVHNRTDYQLTHLLENGHVIRNGVGTYGRAPAIKHIAPVEEWAADELPAEIERGLR